jgi:hypothetical protein
MQAAQNQQEAIGQLNEVQQALQMALAQLAKAEGQKPGQGMKPGDGQKPGEGNKPGDGMKPGEGQGQKPGQGNKPGQKPGQKPGDGMKPGMAEEMNDTMGEGERQPDGQLKNAASKLNDVRGDGAFINLPPRERELVRQALSGKLPPEYAAMIQQYYINIANGKQTAPTANPTPQR